MGKVSKARARGRPGRATSITGRHAPRHELDVAGSGPGPYNRGWARRQRLCNRGEPLAWEGLELVGECYDVGCTAAIDLPRERDVERGPPAWLRLRGMPIRRSPQLAHPPQC